MGRVIKRTDKGIEVKSIEYPVIYSYIYERESEDIKRLADKFKNARIRKPATVSEVKTIIEFRIDNNGKIIPVYDERSTTPKRIRGKAVTSKKAKVIRVKRKPKSSEE